MEQAWLLGKLLGTYLIYAFYCIIKLFVGLGSCDDIQTLKKLHQTYQNFWALLPLILGLAGGWEPYHDNTDRKCQKVNSYDL